MFKPWIQIQDEPPAREPPASEDDARGRPELYANAGVEVLLDQGLVVSHEESVGTGSRDALAWDYDLLSDSEMRDYIHWCFRGAHVAPDLFERVKTAGTPDAGGRASVSISIEALRERVLPTTPLCREEHEWAERRAQAKAANAESEVQAGVKALRITNASGSELSLASWTHLAVSTDAEAHPTLKAGASLEFELTPAPTNEGWVNVSSRGRPTQWVLIWWRGTGANAVARAAGSEPTDLGATTECVGGICKVTIGSADPYRSPGVGVTIDMSTRPRLVPPQRSSMAPQLEGREP